MLKFASLSSGSSGNCILVGYKDTYILIDAGITNKRIGENLEVLGLSPDNICGIFVTHEHGDHVKGLKVFLKNNPIPVYASKGTMSELANKEILGHDLMNVIGAGDSVSINDLKITAYNSYHDTPEPFWYKIETPEGAVAVVTDIGHTTEEMAVELSNLKAILLEANHDINMLETGSYTYVLKRRILSDYGHLSNEACGRFICSILHDGLEAIALGHLSEENNMPEIALMTVRNEIDFAPIDFLSKNLNIFVAGRYNVTKILW